MQAEAVQVQQELDKLAEAYNKLQDDIKNRETALEKLRGDKRFWMNVSARTKRPANA